MEKICYLLPGGDKPIQPSEQFYEEDGYEEEGESGSDEIWTHESTNTNGDNSIVKTLPQPPPDFKNPVTVECAPVSIYELFIFDTKHWTV